MSTLTEGKEGKKWWAIKREKRRALFAIDTAKFNCIGYTVYRQGTARY